MAKIPFNPIVQKAQVAPVSTGAGAGFGQAGLAMQGAAGANIAESVGQAAQTGGNVAAYLEQRDDNSDLNRVNAKYQKHISNMHMEIDSTSNPKEVVKIKDRYMRDAQNFLNDSDEAGVPYFRNNSGRKSFEQQLIGERAKQDIFANEKAHKMNRANSLANHEEVLNDAIDSDMDLDQSKARVDASINMMLDGGLISRADAVQKRSAAHHKRELGYHKRDLLTMDLSNEDQGAGMDATPSESIEAFKMRARESKSLSGEDLIELNSLADRTLKNHEIDKTNKDIEFKNKQRQAWDKSEGEFHKSYNATTGSYEMTAKEVQQLDLSPERQNRLFKSLENQQARQVRSKQQVNTAKQKFAKEQSKSEAEGFYYNTRYDIDQWDPISDPDQADKLKDSIEADKNISTSQAYALTSEVNKRQKEATEVGEQDDSGFISAAKERMNELLDLSNKDEVNDLTQSQRKQLSFKAMDRFRNILIKHGRVAAEEDLRKHAEEIQEDESYRGLLGAYMTPNYKQFEGSQKDEQWYKDAAEQDAEAKLLNEYGE
tara:strand:+ start:391 stop:2019 length:1629 start_codon:yes stop_codon:yes gene_type:complete